MTPVALSRKGTYTAKPLVRNSSSNLGRLRWSPSPAPVCPAMAWVDWRLEKAG